MATVFTKILQGEIPGRIIAQNEHCFALLDIRPAQPGHTLIIPKQEVDYFFDLDEALLNEMMHFSKKVAAAIQKATGASRIGVKVVGLEVPHAHIHLIPIHHELEMDSARAVQMSATELDAMKEKIIAALGDTV
ncbi:MAG: HIT family protein [Patescibacteria group bacterium]|jgi:histidine triad (HIT) family protein